MGIYYKIARSDGWDFYTGKTINYREAVGSIVKHPHPNPKAGMCSDGVLHASKDANLCFIGGKIPCSLYRIEGEPAIAHDDDKAGFVSFKVLEELNPSTHFKWRYDEACNPVHPFRIIPPRIDDSIIILLRDWVSVRISVRTSVWDSIRDSVRASVGDSVWTNIRDNVRASIGASIGDSIRASVWDSVKAYVGYIFIPVVKKWKYIKHPKGEYPFQSAVDLWKMGLVPSYDSTLWRLYGHKDARILWTGKV